MIQSKAASRQPICFRAICLAGLGMALGIACGGVYQAHAEPPSESSAAPTERFERGRFHGANRLLARLYNLDLMLNFEQAQDLSQELYRITLGILELEERFRADRLREMLSDSAAPEEAGGSTGMNELDSDIRRYVENFLKVFSEPDARIMVSLIMGLGSRIEREGENLLFSSVPVHTLSLIVSLGEYFQHRLPHLIDYLNKDSDSRGVFTRTMRRIHGREAGQGGETGQSRETGYERKVAYLGDLLRALSNGAKVHVYHVCEVAPPRPASEYWDRAVDRVQELVRISEAASQRIRDIESRGAGLFLDLAWLDRAARIARALAGVDSQRPSTDGPAAAVSESYAQISKEFFAEARRIHHRMVISRFGTR